MPNIATARDRLLAMPSVELGALPTPIDAAWRLRDAIGMGGRLFVKRDDALPFGFGGNKVRKLTLVGAEARDQGADTLITCGGVQSNHCRATAAAAAKLGMSCHIVANGTRPTHPTGNARLLQLLGAEVTYVNDRTERNPTMQRVAEELRAAGQSPYVIPLGASNPLGAMGFARGVGELVHQGFVPDVIISASSSGGTQAGLIAGCALFEMKSRVIGISADDPVEEIGRVVAEISEGMEDRLGLAHGTLGGRARFEADASFVGEGYGVPTEASREAQGLAAHSEALFTDHWYTAKALAAVVAYGRSGQFKDGDTVLFWHTGGQVGVLA